MANLYDKKGKKVIDQNGDGQVNEADKNIQNSNIPDTDVNENTNISTNTSVSPTSKDTGYNITSSPSAAPAGQSQSNINKEKQKEEKDKYYFNMADNLSSEYKSDYEKCVQMGGVALGREYLDIIQEIRDAGPDFQKQLAATNKLRKFMGGKNTQNIDVNKEWVKGNFMTGNEFVDEVMALQDPSSESSKKVKEASKFVNQADPNTSEGTLAQSVKFDMITALNKAGGDPSRVSPAAYQALWVKYGKEDEFLQRLKAAYPNWTQDELNEQIAYLKGEGEAPKRLVDLSATDNNNYINLLDMTPEQYNDDTIWGDRFGGKAPAALDVAKSAKAAGWNKRQAIAYFKDHLKAWSPAAQEAIRIVYGGGDGSSNDANKYSSGSSMHISPAATEKDYIKTGGKGSGKQPTTGDRNQIESTDTKIADLEARLDDPNLSYTDRERILQQIEEAKAQEVELSNVLAPSLDDIYKYNKNFEDIEKAMSKQRQGGLLWSWIGEANDFGEAIAQSKKTKKDGLKIYDAKIKEINDKISNAKTGLELAQNELEKAEDLAKNDPESEEKKAAIEEAKANLEKAKAEVEATKGLDGDLKKIQADRAVFEAQGDANIEGLKKERKKMHGEYGMFLINAIGTGLKNMPIPGQYGHAPGTEKSLWNQRLEKNLNAETDRHNTLRDKQIEEVCKMVSDIYGNNEEVMKTYNEINADAHAKKIAMDFGIIQKAADVEAIQKMKNAMGTDLSTVLSTMALMGGYGAEDMVFAWLGSSGVNLQSLSNAISDILTNTGDLSANLVESLNTLLEWIMGKGEL